MFDIGLSWLDILPLAPLILPWLAVPGALLAGHLWYRRTRNLYASLGAGLAAAFAVPWTVLLGALLVERGREASDRLGGVARGALLLGVSLVIVTLVLLGINRAGSRRRGGS